MLWCPWSKIGVKVLSLPAPSKVGDKNTKANGLKNLYGWGKKFKNLTEVLLLLFI